MQRNWFGICWNAKKIARGNGRIRTGKSPLLQCVTKALFVNRREWYRNLNDYLTERYVILHAVEFFLRQDKEKTRKVK